MLQFLMTKPNPTEKRGRKATDLPSVIAEKDGWVAYIFLNLFEI